MSSKQAGKWSAIERDTRNKAHAAEVAALRQQLDHAVAQIERLEKSRQAKIIAATPARKRDASDIVRVVIPDTHGAKADRRAIAAMLADIAALDPDEIILLGDHVDCGGHLAQHHVMGYVAETAYSYEDDVAETNAFLDSLRAAGPHARIEYIAAHHERRVETWGITQTLRHSKDAEGLRRLYAPEFRLFLAQRGIPYYRQGEFYDGLPVPGVIRRGKCYFFHGISTAKNATAKTVEKLAGNCVFGHTHRGESTVVRKLGAGVIGSWNPGCLCELQPLWQHTDPTSWTHGYGIQVQAKDGDFLHLNIPIIEGASLFGSLVKL
jgi:predicted phosphodiesterase